MRFLHTADLHLGRRLSDLSLLDDQKVLLGRRMGAEYEVLEGIQDGAKVVTGGQIRLKDGIKVTVNE